MTTADEIDIAPLSAAVCAQPRIALGTFPTPLDEAPTLSERLGLQVLIKRDDLTGLALGGNKVRKLEFLIAEALEHGADCIITTGGSQSNHARLTAAACRRAHLACYLILDRGIHPESQGNLLLDRLFGADVRLIESSDPAAAMDAMNELAERLRADGRHPYVIPRGGSVPAGATGYAAFALELLPQLADARRTATHLYLATGSAGTHAGVLAGITAAGSDIRIQGIAVSRAREEAIDKVAGLAASTLAHLGLPDRFERDSVRVDDRFRGPAYGIPTEATFEAIRTLALDEGIVLDPVYTGKAMAGLMAHAREGLVGPDDIVVFLHTGGAPGVFAYSDEIAGQAWAPA